MDAKYLAEIKARCGRALRNEYPEPVYGSAACYLVANDIPALIAEVERLTGEINNAQENHVDDFMRLEKEIATLEKALELACKDWERNSDSIGCINPDWYIHQAQEGKK